MNKIELTNGVVIDVYDFDPKSKNLIKVDLHFDGKDHEGIWAVVPDELKTKHNDDNETGYGFASLRNHALAFYPNESWGLVIPIKFRGSDRPECDMSLIKDGIEMLWNKKETIEEE